MNDLTKSTNASGWWIAAFLIGTFGTGALKATGILTGPVSTMLFLASFLLIIPMVRANQKAMAARGCQSDAMARYQRRFMVASLSYVALLFASIWIAKTTEPGIAVRVLLAMVAALPVMAMIRAMALLLKEEDDEYLRSRHIQQSLVATGFLLTVSTLYGFLNTFDVAPRVDAWAAFPLWAIGLGLGRLFKGDAAC